MNEHRNDISIAAQMILGEGPRWLHPAIRHALRYALEHLDQPLTLDEIVSAARISKSHFCALVRQTFGMGFMRLVRSVRVAKAKGLLDEANLSVNDICNDPKVGFQNRRQLERAFRQFYGCTPSQYRQGSLERRRHDPPHGIRVLSETPSGPADHTVIPGVTDTHTAANLSSPRL
jgi:AraC-like DNA-binding protein